MDPKDDMPVIITAERYWELVEAEDILNALRRAGVDNWEGYADAMEELDGIARLLDD
jgi:hypothetical protein